MIAPPPPQSTDQCFVGGQSSGGPSAPPPPPALRTGPWGACPRAPPTRWARVQDLPEYGSKASRATLCPLSGQPRSALGPLAPPPPPARPSVSGFGPKCVPGSNFSGIRDGVVAIDRSLDIPRQFTPFDSDPPARPTPHRPLRLSINEIVCHRTKMWRSRQRGAQTWAVVHHR